MPIAQNGLRPLKQAIPAIVLGGGVSGPVLVDGEVRGALGIAEASFRIVVRRVGLSRRRHVATAHFTRRIARAKA